jgi:tetratricopeptide (TPR) repeat protein
MKNFIMASAVLLAFACNNHTRPSRTVYQNKEIVNEKGTTLLVGRNAPYMLKQGPYREWFEKNYNSYATDTTSIDQLSTLLKDKTMEIFLGSWCGDSKREVPRMLKILGQAGFDTTRIHLVFVDYTLKAYKQSPQHEERGKNIHHVPTFIIYEKKKELGRIVESPVASLEKDLLAIVKDDNYIPNYKGILQWQQERNRDKKMTLVQLQEIAAGFKNIISFWGELNGYGYMLFSTGKQEEAYNIFQLNNLLFPDKAGTWSSLGEFYFLAGDKPSARRYYEKVLELKPDDATAKKMMEQF